MSQALTRAVPANPGLTKAVPAATSCCGSKAQKVWETLHPGTPTGTLKQCLGQSCDKQDAHGCPPAFPNEADALMH